MCGRCNRFAILHHTGQGCLAEERSPMLQKHDTCCITLCLAQCPLLSRRTSLGGGFFWVEGFYFGVDESDVGGVRRWVAVASQL